MFTNLGSMFILTEALVLPETAASVLPSACTLAIYTCIDINGEWGKNELCGASQPASSGLADSGSHKRSEYHYTTIQLYVFCSLFMIPSHYQLCRSRERPPADGRCYSACSEQHRSEECTVATGTAILLAAPRRYAHQILCLGK